MDSRLKKFLDAVVGEDGSRALRKATDASADLAWAILPRTIMSWLEVVSHASEFRGSLPGTDVTLSFRKSEGGFSGKVDLAGELYAFRDTTLYHVAGAVAVALGAAPEHAPELRSPALAKLGKSVDLLVKSRTLRKMQERHAGGAKGTLPGTAAAPRAPIGPQGPVSVQPTQPSQVGTKVGVASKQPAKAGAANPSATPKLPGVKPPKKPAIKIGKSEVRARCSVCAGSQFKDGRYIGCICFAELSKNVRTTVVGSSYLLEFGSGWDSDAIVALAENLGK